MVTTTLIEAQDYSSFFRHRVVLNLHYWQEYVTDQTSDVVALDQERDRIIKAISFALELDEAWPAVHKLITTFSRYMERRGHWETWHRILTRSTEITHRVKDVAAEVEVSVLLARLLNRQSRLKETIAYYRRVIRLSRQIGDLYNEARASTNLGYLFIEQEFGIEQKYCAAML